MSKFEVIFVSNGTNKATQRKTVLAEDKNDARRIVEDQGNKVIAVIFKGPVS